MSGTDAQDIQWVIDYVTRDPNITRERFEDAICRLADRSRKVLMAGESGDELRPKLARFSIVRA